MRAPEPTLPYHSGSRPVRVLSPGTGCSMSSVHPCTEQAPRRPRTAQRPMHARGPRWHACAAGSRGACRPRAHAPARAASRRAGCAAGGGGRGARLQARRQRGAQRHAQLAECFADARDADARQAGPERRHLRSAPVGSQAGARGVARSAGRALPGPVHPTPVLRGRQRPPAGGEGGFHAHGQGRQVRSRHGGW